VLQESFIQKFWHNVNFKKETEDYKPKIKHPADPEKPAIVAMAVAVVRCSGGNHNAEMVGPAVNTTGPPRPIMN